MFPIISILSPCLMDKFPFFSLKTITSIFDGWVNSMNVVLFSSVILFTIPFSFTFSSKLSLLILSIVVSVTSILEEIKNRIVVPRIAISNAIFSSVFSFI